MRKTKELTAHVGEVADRISRSLCKKLTPTCLKCPHRKTTVHSTDDPMRLGHTVKLVMECGTGGGRCPDGGNSKEFYAKDIGVARNLHDKILSHQVSVNLPDIGYSMAEVGRVFSSDGFHQAVDKTVSDFSRRVDGKLAIWNATMDFIAADNDLMDLPPDAIASELVSIPKPILWKGNTHEDIESAIVDVRTNHNRPCKEESRRPGSLHKATPYMEDHLAGKYHATFAFKEKGRDEWGNEVVTSARDMYMHTPEFFGEDRPREVTPPPTQEEIYEGWGSFG